MFRVDQKQVRTWLKNQEVIQQQKHSSKASGRGRTANNPIMEDTLYAEYKEARAKGKFLKDGGLTQGPSSYLKTKIKIKSWYSDHCPCRLCKTYMAQSGFI